jgi:hypothetical protein
MSEDNVIIWEAPTISKPEFRLYYDDLGNVICYTGEKLAEGNYIVIDAITFAEARPDVRVIDGRIVKDSPNATIVRLTLGNSGTLCAVEDLSVIVSKEDDIEKQYWKLEPYELS